MPTHVMEMRHPNRAQWRMIEALFVAVVIAGVLTLPTEVHRTRLALGLAIFGALLVGRHFRR